MTTSSSSSSSSTTTNANAMTTTTTMTTSTTEEYVSWSNFTPALSRELSDLDEYLQEVFLQAMEEAEKNETPLQGHALKIWRHLQHSVSQDHLQEELEILADNGDEFAEIQLYWLDKRS